MNSHEKHESFTISNNEQQTWNADNQLQES